MCPGLHNRFYMIQDEFRPTLRTVGSDVADDLKSADPVGEILFDGGLRVLNGSGKRTGV